MILSARTGLALGGLSVVGVLTHSIPHDMGVSTVGAIGMLCAAFLPRAASLVPVLITVAFVDALSGGYGLVAMSFVYVGHVAAAIAVRPVLRSTGPRTVLIAAVVNAVVFYLLSNITPMAMAYYPPTLEGWFTCYVNGLPFLLRGTAANIVFGGVFFGFIWLVAQYGAGRFAAAQRH